MKSVEHKEDRSCWAVYLLECVDGSFYCGCTNNIEKRVITHNAGRGAKYTRSRLPVKLVAHRDGLTHSEALKLEMSIKKLPRNKKIFTLIDIVS